MRNTDLRHLEFLSETEWGRTHLKELLQSPHVGLWQSLSEDHFSDGFDLLESRLGSDSETGRLLDLRLITEALLQREGAPAWFIQWVCEHVDVPGYLSPLDWQTCMDGRWDAAPVILVHERAYLRYFILGLVGAPDGTPCWPEWADCLLDETAQRGILSAMSASTGIYRPELGQRPFCYPLTVPNRNVQFTHASLGLPLSLGFMALLREERVHQDIVASGTVGANGSVGKVGRLTMKVGYARKAGFKVFLFPSDNRPPPQANGVDMLPVSNLAEAWTLSGLYAPGQTGKLLMLGTMLDDPVTFANNCTLVPSEWLAWVHQNGRTQRVMGLIQASPFLFDTYVERLGTCLNKGELVQAETLIRLLEPASVKALAEDAHLSVFKWFSINLSMANHRGDVSASLMWEEEADRLVQRSPVTDVEAFADFCNHRFIGSCHNRYHFSPELPGFIKGLLTSLEGQYRSQRQLVENAVNKTLGALYGSIAQNYGFCGPRWIEETEGYVRLSQKAFGGGTAPECKDDWLRQFGYLTYACLDAGNFQAAGNALMAYLEIRDWQELRPKLSGLTRWHHAALARFFAESREREKGRAYAEWALPRKSLLCKEMHPWQLWLCNMGRLLVALGDRASAIEYHKESVSLCASGRLGRTVQIMALLPLAALWEGQALAGLDVTSLEEQIRQGAQDLNPAHFRPVLSEPDFEKVLENVWGRPEGMFPFTYR